MKSSITIVIPNYNGLALLQKHFHSIVENGRNYPIIIVDDASTDNSIPWIKQKYPQVETIVNSHNQGFAASVNTGFKAAKTDLVLLLNNDVTINRQTISALEKNFADKKLFAVGALEQLTNAKKRGKSKGSFQRGLLIHQSNPERIKGPTLWVFGASGMFNRKIWQQLGGLDDLYKPAYWEDIDISYRAWKAGFICLFDPAATLHHDSEATMNPTLGSKKSVYAFKNQLLFFWKNVTDISLIFQHFFWMPYHLTVTTYKTKGAFLYGFYLALCQLSQVMHQTSHYKDVRTDSQIITLSSSTK